MLDMDCLAIFIDLDISFEIVGRENMGKIKNKEMVKMAMRYLIFGSLLYSNSYVYKMVTFFNFLLSLCLAGH